MNTAATPDGAQARCSALTASQYQHWYPIFRFHALKSKTVRLPAGFLEYLQEDGVFVPDDSAAVPAMEPLNGGLIVEGEYRRDDWGPPDLPPRPGSPRGALSGARDGVLSGDANPTASATNGTPNVRDESTGDDGYGSSSSSSSAQDSEDGRGHVDWVQRFPAFKRAVEAAISELGGRVVPKLNWSCPSDALWVSATNSLACRNADEVVLLLKSSDRVAHDVSLLAAVHEAAAAAGAHTHAAPAAAAAAGAQAATPSSEGAGGTAHLEEGGSGGAKQQEQRQQQQQQPQGHQHGEAAGAGGDSTPSPASGGGGGSCGTPDQGVAGPADSGRGSEAPCGDSAVEPSVLAPVLVLKKWCNLRPEREFRCFVRGCRLVACCQRDVSQAFPALADPGAVQDVRQRLWGFWSAVMDPAAGGAGSRFSLRDYAYDVYVPSDGSSVRLVDINPLADSTSPLLFSWEELGFGPGSVPSAEQLARAAAGHQQHHQQQQQQQEPGPEAGAAVDESWMDEAASLAALPLPQSAAELQVRLVEGGDPRVGGGDGLGPMLLGPRAACAMPYDMVGIADSVERMIAMMQRAGGHGGEGGEGEEDSEQEGEEGEQEGRGRGGNSGARLPFGIRGAGAAVGGVVVGGRGGGSGGDGEGGPEGEGVAWGVGVDGEGEEAAVAGMVAEVQMLLGMDLGEADGTLEL